MQHDNGPAVHPDKVAADLRHLTKVLIDGRHSAHVGGLLGGEYGYATDYTNEIFELRPYYWGDCVCDYEANENRWYEQNHHAPDCYQSVIRDRGFLDHDAADAAHMTSKERDAHNHHILDAVCADMGLDPAHGVYVHCTCDYEARYTAWANSHHHAPACPVDKPNFLHKPTGTAVSFYKYLGRSMELDIRGDWHQIVTECVESIPARRR